MPNWKEYKLSELVETVIDNRGKTCPVQDTGFPLIATNCIRNEKLYPDFVNVRYVSDETYRNWFRGHPEPCDLIFVLKGTPGRVCWTPDPVNFCIAQDMVALRAKKELIYPKYLFAVLRSPMVQQKIESLHVGSLIPHFKKGDFDKLLIPVIEDYSLQKYIGDTYYDFCDKIELNNQINQELEALAQALFKQWFIDFEFPNENGQPYKSSGGEMVESELGEIPKGWKVGAIYDVSDVINGAPFKSSLFNKEKIGLPLIRIRDLKTNEPQFWTNEQHPKGMIIKPGDLIVGMDAEFRPHFWLGSNAWLNQRLCQFKPKNNYSRLFIREVIRPQLQFFENSSVGTTVIHLGKGDIDSFKSIIPSSAVLTEFYNLSETIVEAIVDNSGESKNLQNLRDVLLPKLISGELEVSEALTGKEKITPPYSGSAKMFDQEGIAVVIEPKRKKIK